MKIKVNQTITTVDGIQPLKDETGHNLVLKDVCINAVLIFDEKDDEKKKWEKYEIYKKLRNAVDEVTLTAEEVAVIKKSIAKVNAPLVMGQCFELLEG